MQPVSDAELQEFIALDKRATDASWRWWVPSFLEQWLELSTRMAGRMAEELLRRRHDDRHLTHDVAEFYTDDAPGDMGEWHGAYRMAEAEPLDEWHEWHQNRMVGG